MESEDIVDGGGESPKTERRMSRRFETVSLLENNRMRNIGLWLCLFSFCSLINQLPTESVTHEYGTVSEQYIFILFCIILRSGGLTLHLALGTNHTLSPLEA